MWTGEKGLFHMKYLLNKKFSTISYLSILIGSDEGELKISDTILS